MKLPQIVPRSSWDPQGVRPGPETFATMQLPSEGRSTRFHRSLHGVPQGGRGIVWGKFHFQSKNRPFPVISQLFLRRLGRGPLPALGARIDSGWVFRAQDAKISSGVAPRRRGRLLVPSGRRERPGTAPAPGELFFLSSHEMSTLRSLRLAMWGPGRGRGEGLGGRARRLGWQAARVPARIASSWHSGGPPRD